MGGSGTGIYQPLPLPRGAGAILREKFPAIFTRPGDGSATGGNSANSTNSQFPFSFPPPGSGPGSGFNWAFPQYSQTWAFTPPTPSRYMNAPGFDPKSPTGYAAAPKPATSTATAAASSVSPLSLASLMSKYSSGVK